MRLAGPAGAFLGGGVVKGGDTDDLTDAAQFRDRSAEHSGRFANISPQADERAHRSAL